MKQTITSVGREALFATNTTGADKAIGIDLVLILCIKQLLLVGTLGANLQTRNKAVEIYC